jgi:hypothetical protein
MVANVLDGLGQKRVLHTQRNSAIFACFRLDHLVRYRARARIFSEAKNVEASEVGHVVNDFD